MAKHLHSKEHQALIRLLRTEREEKAVRQIDLAKKLGKPQSFVSKYEAGERRLDVLELRELCRALGIELVHFVQKFERSLGVSGKSSK